MTTLIWIHPDFIMNVQYVKHILIRNYLSRAGLCGQTILLWYFIVLRGLM